MAKGINFEPFKTQGNFKGSFNLESRGYVQGDAQADPAVRLQLSSGWLPNDFDGPVFGGMPVLECLTNTGMNVAGSTIQEATTAANAIIVFNQAYHGVITASSNVPQYLPGGTVHYYRMGSLARIPMAISAAVLDLATSGTTPVNQVFVWDAENLYVDVQGTDGGGGFSVDDAKEGEDEAAAAAADTRVVLNIKLLQVADQGNNLTIVKDENGSLSWAHDQPIGVFMI